MEKLDIYDEYGNYLGSEDRNLVHEKGLWHKTVHCWLYDQKGRIFFQRRKDQGTLYTTASGHLQAGESIADGFAREIYEEIGIHIDARDAKRVHERIWKMDKIRPDGKDVHDRAFANVYVDLYEGDYQDFHFDPNEVLGLVLVDAKQVKKMFEEGHGSVVGTELTENHQQIQSLSRDISFDEFLVMEGETALLKYGEILDKVIALSCQE